MDKINVLITGSGSVIGYGAVKLIKDYSFVNKLVAGNVTSDFPAVTLTDNVLIYPDFYFAKNSSIDNFLNHILNYCRNEHIHAIVPCSCFELKVFAENIQLFERLGVTVFVETINTLELFFDKFKTAKFIKNINAPSLNTGILNHSDNLQLPKIAFPFIIKPRFGYGSKGIQVIYTVSDFEKWNYMKSKKFSDYIFQEYIENDSEEYSCSVIYQNNSPVSARAIRRELKNGDTIKAIFDRNCRQKEKMILDIAKLIEGKYCLNFQFRMKDDVPYIFEVNPRFAASEIIRAIFGQDPYYQSICNYFGFVMREQNYEYGKVVRIFEEKFIKTI